MAVSYVRCNCRRKPSSKEISAALFSSPQCNLTNGSRTRSFGRNVFRVASRRCWSPVRSRRMVCSMMAYKSSRLISRPRWLHIASMRFLTAAQPSSARNTSTGPGLFTWNLPIQGVAEATLIAMSRPSHDLQHLGCPPIRPTADFPHKESMSHSCPAGCLSSSFTGQNWKVSLVTPITSPLPR